MLYLKRASCPVLLAVFVLVLALCGCMRSRPAPDIADSAVQTGEGVGVPTAPASSPLCGMKPVDCTCLHRWLVRSYAESANYAAFGDYPGENLDTASLHQTQAAIALLRNDVPAAPLPELPRTASWVESLRQPDGLYDDPVTPAPILLETCWALEILSALGAAPGDPASTQRALLDSLPPVDSLRPGELADPAGETLSTIDMVVRALEALDGGATGTGSQELRRLASALADVVAAGELASADAKGEGEGADIVATAASLVSHLMEEGSPACVKRRVLKTLSGIAEYPAGFLGEGGVLAAVDSARLAFGWAALPDAVLEDVKLYLAVTEPAELAQATHGFTNDEWPWADPALNVSRTALYRLAGIRNPAMPSLTDVMERLRCADGWSTVIFAVPSLDFTYYAVRIALASGASFVNYEKVRAYAADALSGPDAAVQDLLYSVRILKTLGDFTDWHKDTIKARVGALGESEARGEVGAILRLLVEAELPLPDKIRTVIFDHESALLSSLAEPRADALFELAYALRLLGDASAVSLEAIAAGARTLQTVSGGYRWSMRGEASVGTLPATYCVVEALAAVGCLDSMDVDAVRSFVLTSWLAPGFRIIRPADDLDPSDVAFPDLLIVYEGTRVLEWLAAP